MINSLLQFSCDVYHLTDSVSNVGYGLPQEQKKTYPLQPDIPNARCYYYLVQNNTQQLYPDKELTLIYKVIFGPNEDIRFNDKITIGGIPFILEFPERKLNSHIEAIAKRLI